MKRLRNQSPNDGQRKKQSLCPCVDTSCVHSPTRLDFHAKKLFDIWHFDNCSPRIFTNHDELYDFLKKQNCNDDDQVLGKKEHSSSNPTCVFDVVRRLGYSWTLAALCCYSLHISTDQPEGRKTKRHSKEKTNISSFLKPQRRRRV